MRLNLKKIIVRQMRLNFEKNNSATSETELRKK